MTLEEAIQHFFNSDVYKEKSKVKDSEGGVLRNFKSRHGKGTLGKASSISMLEKYGYTIKKIEVIPPKK